MGAILVLIGLLFLMLSYLWITGEALKKDLWLGLSVLLLFPISGPYYAFVKDSRRCMQPLIAGIIGLIFVVAGKRVGL